MKFVLFDILSGYYYSAGNPPPLVLRGIDLFDEIVEAKVFDETEKNKFPLKLINREHDVYLEFQELSDKQISEINEWNETKEKLLAVKERLSILQGKNRDCCVTMLLEILDENLDESEKNLAANFLLR